MVNQASLAAHLATPFRCRSYSSPISLRDVSRMTS